MSTPLLNNQEVEPTDDSGTSALKEAKLMKRRLVSELQSAIDALMDVLHHLPDNRRPMGERVPTWCDGVGFGTWGSARVIYPAQPRLEYGLELLSGRILVENHTRSTPPTMSLGILERSLYNKVYRVYVDAASLSVQQLSSTIRDIRCYTVRLGKQTA